MNEIEITKLVQNAESTPDYIDCIYKEITENTIKYFKIYLFQEYMSHNLLASKFKYWLKYDASDYEKGAFYRSLFASLKPLADLKITHNDIKPANIMIGLNPNISTQPFTPVKLIDFGLSDYYGRDTFSSTRCYDMNKPENSKFRVVHDIYAMAITIAELESSFSNICKEYLDNGCHENNNQKCIDDVKLKVFNVMKPIFQTTKNEENKLIFNVKKCRDFGCIVLGCLKFNASKMPSLNDILKAFDNVANGTFDETNYII